MTGPTTTTTPHHICPSLSFSFPLILFHSLYLPSLFISSLSLNSITSVDAKHTSINSTGSDGSSSNHGPLLAVDPKKFKAIWTEEVSQNRERWKAQATKGTLRLNRCPEGYATKQGAMLGLPSNFSNSQLSLFAFNWKNGKQPDKHHIQMSL